MWQQAPTRYFVRNCNPKRFRTTGLICKKWYCISSLFFMYFFSLTVSQDPELIPLMRVNSSAEITCSTSLSNPMGLNLYRQFHGNMKVVYLSLDNGQVTRNTIAPEFEGRIHHQQMKDGHGFTLQLSLLRQEDTDLYYCSWQYFEKSLETLQSNGTMIIVRGKRTSHLISNMQTHGTFIFLKSFKGTSKFKIHIFPLACSAMYQYKLFWCECPSLEPSS